MKRFPLRAVVTALFAAAMFSFAAVLSRAEEPISSPVTVLDGATVSGYTEAIGDATRAALVGSFNGVRGDGLWMVVTIPADGVPTFSTGVTDDISGSIYTRASGPCTLHSHRRITGKAEGRPVRLRGWFHRDLDGATMILTSGTAGHRRAARFKLSRVMEAAVRCAEVRESGIDGTGRMGPMGHIGATRQPFLREVVGDR